LVEVNIANGERERCDAERERLDSQLSEALEDANTQLLVSEDMRKRLAAADAERAQLHDQEKAHVSESAHIQGDLRDIRADLRSYKKTTTVLGLTTS